MEDLKYQQWSLGRQLTGFYRDLDLSVPSGSTGEEPDLDQLKSQEEKIRSEVRALLCRLPGVPLTKSSTGSSQDDETGNNKASQALRNYLAAHGGQLGGWDEKDHSVFLHWRSRFRLDRASFLSALKDTLPGKTQEQVEEHDKWYQKLQKLRCEQRREIDEWKRKKKEEEEEEKKRAASGSEQDEDANTWVTSWKKQREVVQEQIQKWKEERANRQAQVAAESEPSEAEKKRAEAAEQKRRTEHQYQKLLAYLWRMEQEAAKEAVDKADEFVAKLNKKQSQQQSAYTAAVLAEHRENQIQRWIQSRRPRRSSEPEAFRSSSCLPNTFRRGGPRDPERLFRPTSSSLARRLPDEEQDGVRPRDNGHRYILDIPSRMVPRWRQTSAAARS